MTCPNQASFRLSESMVLCMGRKREVEGPCAGGLFHVKDLTTVGKTFTFTFTYPLPQGSLRAPQKTSQLLSSIFLFLLFRTPWSVSDAVSAKKATTTTTKTVSLSKNLRKTHRRYKVTSRLGDMTQSQLTVPKRHEQRVVHSRSLQQLQPIRTSRLIFR